VPPVFADHQDAWEGTASGDIRLIRIEAASHHGQPVYFEVMDASGASASTTTESTATSPRAVIVIDMAIVIGSLLLARHNLRLGRADRRGALRTAAIIAGSALAARALLAHNIVDFLPFIGNGLPLAAALAGAVIPWLFYVALEPYVRRAWPEMLIGWTRLLAGRIRDPIVGRDLLVGTPAGVVLAACGHLRFLIPAWAGLTTPSPVGLNPSRATDVLTMLSSGHGTLSLVSFSVINGVSIGLLSAAALVFLSLLLRGRKRASVAWVLLWTFAQQVPTPGEPIVDFAFKLISFTVGIVLLVGFGLLPMAVHLIANGLLTVTALRFDGPSPFVTASYLLVGIVAGLAAYGFRTALAGRSVFADMLSHATGAPFEPRRSG
jgi:eukaryotic-like serine/threonine-protein kinase